MKKLISIFSLALFSTFACHGMKTNYVLSEKELSKEERALEQKFNTLSDKIDDWLDKYSTKQIDKSFSKISESIPLIIQEKIKSFVQEPVQGKKLSVQQHNFTELKKALKEQKINDFFIKNILYTLMLEVFVYAHLAVQQQKSYLCDLVQYLEETKKELRKPLDEIAK